MSWEAVGTFAMVIVGFAGLHMGALRWMFIRHQEAMTEYLTRWSEFEHQFYELRVALPIEYVRREDWIRFSGTLDAKLDALREEMREEIGAVKEKLYV